VARGVRAEAPMSWVPRRSVSADGCPWEGMTCAMRGRYSLPNITKFGNTYPKRNASLLFLDNSKTYLNEL
ncbi:MAG: hypothetical protein ACTSVA_07525, partial [Candidatus Njordarchaeales archaeon]